MELDRFRHESFVTGATTIVGYGVIVVAMFLVLFVLPYLVFLALG